MTRWRRRHWTEEARRAASESWTPERREEARQRRLDPEFEARRRTTYEQRYPGRMAAYEAFRRQLAAGEIAELPCDRCGGVAHAMLRFEGEPVVAVVETWRCYPCRKATPNRN